jgi:asparagine synthase (glutamine-hydrolysing)
MITIQFYKGVNRGPETSIIESHGNKCMIGFHRLAINGLNEGSNQPLKLDDNLTLICNGEIYNYKELYQELDITPNTQSDCEVILHLYKKYGIDHTLRLLDGVFAFLLIDYNVYSETAKIFVARDPLGVRPLYMLSLDNDIFGFASELKVLNEFYQTYIESMNNHVEHILPGTYSRFEMNYNVNMKWELVDKNHIYYHPGVIVTMEDPELVDESYDNHIEKYIPGIQQQLRTAVFKRCSTTERPIACLLSGGLDSSLITALVNEYHIIHELKNPLETYSIGLEGSVDLANARIVAEYLGTKHTEIVLTETDFIDAVNDVIFTIESYDTTTVRASIGNYLLGKWIQDNSEAKVIFNGDGSDELTGGYLYFHKTPNAIEFDYECRRLLKDIYLYDVLRSDKSISSHGLEPRTPFLDRGWVQYYLSIPAKLRCHTIHGKCEKHLLRTAFSEEYFLNSHKRPLLPKDILWRTKEAFSDGVSKTSRSLYEILQENATHKYKDMDAFGYRFDQYEHNTPTTVEQLYYRNVFESYYTNLGKIVPYFWMPRYVNASDASARTLDIYSSRNNSDNK